MSYGLKGKVRQMVTEMQQVRNPGPTGIAKDVTLREHMAKNYKHRMARLCRQITCSPSSASTKTIRR
jgi:hypothetical protein